MLGEDALKQEWLAQVSAQARAWHYGEAVQESAAAKAQGIVREELARRKWTEQILGARRKGDADKAAIAQRPRRETTAGVDCATAVDGDPDAPGALALLAEPQEHQKGTILLTDPFMQTRRVGQTTISQ